MHMCENTAVYKHLQMQGQVGWEPGQRDQVVGSPAQDRGLAPDDL